MSEGAAGAPSQVLALTARADMGGGPEHLYQLAQGLSEHYKMVIACPEEPPYRARYQTLRTVSGVIDLPHRAFKPGVLLALAREIRSRKIAVIHSHGKGAGLYGRLLAMMTGRPCVHTFHGLHVGQYDALRLKLYLGLERFLGRFTKAAIAVSDGERAQIAEAGILADAKLLVVPNGVVIPKAAALRTPGGPLRIVAVNRYDYHKNPDLLLDIARHLKAETGETFRMIVLGQGERLEEMRATARAEGLDAVIDFAGPHDNPRAVFREVDVFLSTSRWEGMPLAVLEAMSESLPVVATDVVGNRDVVEDGVTGQLFANEDGAAGAAALAAMEFETRQAFGAAGRRVAEQKYSVARMVADTEAVYDRCLA